MIEPQSMQDGASAWVAKATGAAQDERDRRGAGAVRLAVAVRVAIGVPVRRRLDDGEPSGQPPPGGDAARGEVGASAGGDSAADYRPCVGRRCCRAIQRDPAAGAGAAAIGAGAAERGRHRERHRLAQEETAPAGGSSTSAERSIRPRAGLVVGRQEARAEPAEDVVHDRLGDRDLRVAGEAGRLEADVRELVDQVPQRHAVLERDRDHRGERVHEAANGRAFLGHLQEDLAGLAVGVEARR